jgi:monothiol glutaredoxin
MNETWKKRIEESTKANQVMVYMRGTPTSPRCGFSARVMKVLQDNNIAFQSDDMDSDPELWRTLSELNDWPTSPQIYVNGEFVGGCDIFMEMNRNGDLKKMIESAT